VAQESLRQSIRGFDGASGGAPCSDERHDCWSLRKTQDNFVVNEVAKRAKVIMMRNHQLFQKKRSYSIYQHLRFWNGGLYLRHSVNIELSSEAAIRCNSIHSITYGKFYIATAVVCNIGNHDAVDAGRTVHIVENAEVGKQPGVGVMTVSCWLRLAH
jgi:hypothetical protein